MTGPGGRSPSVGLVVVNHRSAQLVDGLLAGCSAGADDVVVVDCTPGEPQLAEVCERRGARFVDPGTNLGYGAGANLGAAALEPGIEVVVVANPDLEVSADALRHLAGAARGVGLAAPRFTFPDGGLQRSAHRREPRGATTAFDLSVPFQAVAARLSPRWHPTLLPASDHARSLDCLHVLGALLAVDAAAFASVGGFDPAFFLYREETDLCHRLRSAGWTVRHEGTVTAVHHGGGSTPEGDAPLAAQPQHLDSHYRYIARHWGPWARRWCRAVGLVASCSSAVTGPQRPAWRTAARWHLGGR